MNSQTLKELSDVKSRIALLTNHISRNKHDYSAKVALDKKIGRLRATNRYLAKFKAKKHNSN